MNRLATVIAIAGLMVACPDPAVAQSESASNRRGRSGIVGDLGQFDRADVGLGGRLAWHPTGLIGIESEISLYPRDFPDQVPFSRGRVEGLFGVTVGPRFDRVRPFARLRPGFLRIREAPRPYACILIYPPPLSCNLALGRTIAAFDIGGGVEISATRRTFVRVDAGDRLLKYPGPVIDNNRTRQDDSFFSHDFRFAVGAGFQF